MELSGCSRHVRVAAVAGASLLKMLLILTALGAASLLFEIEMKSAGSTGCCNSEEAFPPANSTGLDATLRELIARGWLSTSDNAICVGPGAAPAAVAMRGLGLRAAAVAPAAAAAPCCGLLLATASFDFAFVAALDRVRVPARVVLEMERVIRPGRFGAVRRGRLPGPAGLARAAAPVAALLRASDVVGALPVDGAAVVVFRKRGGASPIPTRATARWCGDAGITKLSRALDEIIEQVTAAFPPELLKFQSYPELRSETT